VLDLSLEEAMANEDVGRTGPPGPDSSDDTLLTPYEKPYRLENWDFDDLVMYVGGIYAKEAYSN
jgi:hypothetical protein